MAVPPDLPTLLAALFLLLGVPAILIGLIVLYTGYVRYDAEQYLDELDTEPLQAPRDGESGPDDAADDSANRDDSDDRGDTDDRGDSEKVDS